MSAPHPGDRTGRRGWRIVLVSLLAAALIVIAGRRFFGVHITASVSTTDCAATPAGEGSIHLSIAGKFTPFNVHWFGPTVGSLYATGSQVDLTGLVHGNYLVSVADAYGLTDKRNIHVPHMGLASIDVMIEPTDLTSADGSIVGRMTPACTGCSYQWEDGPMTAARIDLAAGVYRVDVSLEGATPACVEQAEVKLLPVYPAPCTDWSGRNDRVRSLTAWTALEPISQAPYYQYAMRADVAVLLPLAGGGLHIDDCTGAPLLTYTFDLALLSFLRAHTFVAPVTGKWPLTTPVTDVGSPPPAYDHLAAELFILRLNLLNVDVKPPAPTVNMVDAVYLGPEFPGATVGEILIKAVKAVGCGKDENDVDLTPAQFQALHQVLVNINDGGFHLACPW